ncbi:MAG: hypothetical protein ACRC0G_13245 [Fusobacteriaceae bacterium]
MREIRDIIAETIVEKSKNGGKRAGAGRKPKEITKEMLDDLSNIGKTEYTEKYKISGATYYNLAKKHDVNVYRGVVKKVEVVVEKEIVVEKVFDVLASVLIDIEVMHKDGIGAWYRHVQSKQQESDYSCSDILHKIEICDLTDNDMIMLCSKLKYYRNMRRAYNDSMDFYTDNKQAIIGYFELTKKVENRKEYLARRTYKTRILKKELGEEIK